MPNSFEMSSAPSLSYSKNCYIEKRLKFMKKKTYVGIFYRPSNVIRQKSLKVEADTIVVIRPLVLEFIVIPFFFLYFNVPWAYRG